jgi:hypothetical protein
MTHETSGGVNAEPAAAATMSQEKENPRLDAGIELAMARDASGYAAASPTPRTKRMTMSATSAAMPAGTTIPGTSPVRSVVANQSTAAAVSVCPGPRRSPDTPHGT